MDVVKTNSMESYETFTKKLENTYIHCGWFYVLPFTVAAFLLITGASPLHRLIGFTSSASLVPHLPCFSSSKAVPPPFSLSLSLSRSPSTCLSMVYHGRQNTASFSHITWICAVSSATRSLVVALLRNLSNAKKHPHMTPVGGGFTRRFSSGYNLYRRH